MISRRLPHLPENWLRLRLSAWGTPLTFFAADQALGLLCAFADVHRVRTPILVGWGHSLRGLR